MSLHKCKARAVDINRDTRTRVYITSGFVLLLAAVTVLCGVRVMLVTLIAAGVHELGHILCACLCGGRVLGLRLDVSGGELEIDGLFSYMEDALIALSGPFAGAMLAAGALCCGELAGWAWTYELAAASTLYTMFNLMPVSGLDGGRALYAVLCKTAGLDMAARICLVCDISFSILFAALGLYAFFVTGRGITIPVCAFFVIKGCCKRRGTGVKSIIA